MAFKGENLFLKMAQEPRVKGQKARYKVSACSLTESENHASYLHFGGSEFYLGKLGNKLGLSCAKLRHDLAWFELVLF